MGHRFSWWWLLAGAGIGGLSLGWWARHTLPKPGLSQEVSIQCAQDAPMVEKGMTLRVLVWNIQFAGSRKHHFFYDGGDAVHVPETDVHETLARIEAVIAQTNPDIVMLQEVDRHSRRTQYIDQHTALLDGLQFPCHGSTPYHHVPYVPHPSQKHLGRVGMHLSIFSRFQMNNGVRLQLPLLNESKLRQFFNLRRAVFMAELPIAGQEEPLLLLNTHLSAFSGGDDTLTRQISTLTKQLKKADHHKTPWILAGDFNALPPNDDPNRLGSDAAQYSVPSALTPLFQEYQPSVSLAELDAHPESWGTYIPPNNKKADRTIDYIFLSDRLTSQTFTTLNEHTEISDHLPLLMEFEVR